jgi:hypothetical protein
VTKIVVQRFNYSDKVEGQKRVYQNLNSLKIREIRHAGGGNRTHTSVARDWILSETCLTLFCRHEGGHSHKIGRISHQNVSRMALKGKVMQIRAAREFYTDGELERGD